jgi:hypothetical protein
MSAAAHPVKNRQLSIDGAQDMHGVARERSDALNHEITYPDIPPRIGNGR